MKTVNQTILCGTVWSYIMQDGHGKPLLIWCQWGTFCKENVNDVVDTCKSSSDYVRVAVNEDESADIPAFIQSSLDMRVDGEKLIIISVLPWGREAADEIMGRYETDFQCVRYQADAEEWTDMNFRQSNFNEPLLGFLKKHPEFFMLPYGEKPLLNSVGPCPSSWADLDSMWSDLYLRKFHEWRKMRPSAKIRTLLLAAAMCVGNYEQMITKLEKYLENTRGYDKLQLPPQREFDDGCNNIAEMDGKEKPAEAGSNFRNLFDNNGNLIWN